MSELLNLPIVDGCLITVDALLTQREVAREIVSRGADYRMVVKENQPQLLEDIRLCFEAEPLPGEVRGRARTVDKGHGRLEVREIVTSTALKEFLAHWPGLEQLLQITRTVTKMSTGETTTVQVYGITGLPPERGSPELLLEAGRGHWTAESIPWVRDVTLGEDACAVHKNRSSQVLAALRNAVMAVIRLAGFTCTAEAIRRYAARPMRAVRTIRSTGGLYDRAQGWDSAISPLMVKFPAPAALFGNQKPSRVRRLPLSGGRCKHPGGTPTDLLCDPRGQSNLTPLDKHAILRSGFGGHRRKENNDE